MSWQNFIDIADRLFSWPIIVLVLCIFFKKQVIRVLSELADFIKTRALIIKGPGGTEVQMLPSQAETETKEIKGIVEGLVVFATEEREELRKETEEIEEKLSQVKGEKRKLEALIKDVLTEKETEILRLKIDYLNVFLVPATKWVLEWFSFIAVRADRNSFHNSWHVSIPKHEEREAILRALLDNDLIVEEGGEIKITEFGKFFIEVCKRHETIPPPPPHIPPPPPPYIPPPPQYLTPPPSPDSTLPTKHAKLELGRKKVIEE